MKEVSGIEKIGEEDFLRLIRPLVTDESCLQCHARQGYRVGDIRGGIGVSIAMKPFYAIMEAGVKRLSLIHGIVWLFLSSWSFGGTRLKVVTVTSAIVKTASGSCSAI